MDTFERFVERSRNVDKTDILPSFSIEIEKGIYLSVSIFLFDFCFDRLFFRRLGRNGRTRNGPLYPGPCQAQWERHPLKPRTSVTAMLASLSRHEYWTR